VARNAAGRAMIAPRNRLLETARLAAVAAGEAILKVYASDFEVYQKTDKTPVTEADLAAERIIVEVLTDAFPHIPIVSEELADRGELPPAAERFWAVDPLDGTKEFIARNGEFAVLIGLIEKGRPVLGIVHGPAVGLTYAACGPGTATRQFKGGEIEPIHARRPDAGGLVVVHSRSHENSRRLAEYLERYRVRERVKCGSALKFGLLAAGEGDLYPRFGTTMEWDTAAGQAVLEAAGGHVERIDGGPLGYGKPGFKNDGFLAWGRR
jgi:3'(2'), 5'-bisphosphate nucleotidase